MTIAATRPAEQTALLDAIFARPDDDTPRLVYADALDEEAGWLTPRSELIRVQCELGRLCPILKGGKPTSDNYPQSRKRAFALIARESALRTAHEAEWRCPMPCERCGGEGRVRTDDAVLRLSYENQTGRLAPYLLDISCPTCHGLGQVGVLGARDPIPDLETIAKGGWQIPVDWVRGFPVVSCPVAWWCEEGVGPCPKCGTSYGGGGCDVCGGDNVTNGDYPNSRRAWEEQAYLTLRLSGELRVVPSDLLRLYRTEYPGSDSLDLDRLNPIAAAWARGLATGEAG